VARRRVLTTANPHIAGAASEGAPVYEKRKHRRGAGRGRKRDIPAEIQATARARQRAWADRDGRAHAPRGLAAAVEGHKQTLDELYADKRKTDD
jgi:hypothetical protein